MSILAFRGLDPDLLAQYPTALQVVHNWACRMRIPDPHGFIDSLAAKLLANPPLETHAFTDKVVVRYSAILIFALGAVQAGRDTSLAAELSSFSTASATPITTHCSPQHASSVSSASRVIFLHFRALQPP